MPADPTVPWYSCVPVGKNTLMTMMKKMALKGGINRKVTNHSLRAYSVSKLYKENIPENVIMDRSGHRSIDGVREYTRVSQEQEIQACQALCIDRAAPQDHQLQPYQPTNQLQIARQPMPPVSMVVSNQMPPPPAVQQPMFQCLETESCFGR